MSEELINAMRKAWSRQGILLLFLSIAACISAYTAYDHWMNGRTVSVIGPSIALVFYLLMIPLVLKVRRNLKSAIAIAEAKEKRTE